MTIETTVRKIAAEVYAEREAARDDSARDWLPHPRWGIAPSNRECCELARCGRIDGARKVGRCWYARRESLDKYIEENAEQVEAGTVVDIVDRVLERRRAG